MKKPHDAWQVASMIYKDGGTKSTLKILGAIATMDYIIVEEIVGRTGLNQQTVRSALPTMVKAGIIGYRIQNNHYLYKLADERFIPYFLYLASAAYAAPLGPSLVQVLRAVEQDNMRLVYEIGAEVGLSEKRVKNLLTDAFKAGILRKRDIRKGYQFKTILRQVA